MKLCRQVQYFAMTLLDRRRRFGFSGFLLLTEVVTHSGSLIELSKAHLTCPETMVSRCRNHLTHTQCYFAVRWSVSENYYSCRATSDKMQRQIGHG